MRTRQKRGVVHLQALWVDRIVTSSGKGSLRQAKARSSPAAAGKYWIVRSDMHAAGEAPRHTDATSWRLGPSPADAWDACNCHCGLYLGCQSNCTCLGAPGWWHSIAYTLGSWKWGAAEWSSHL